MKFQYLHQKGKFYLPVELEAVVFIEYGVDEVPIRWKFKRYYTNYTSNDSQYTAD